MVKILCLHGFAQSPEEFRSKSVQIQRALPDVDFVFPQAAIALVTYDGDLQDRSRKSVHSASKFSWNHLSEDMSSNLINLEALLSHLTPILERQGPFDGIMGFSQGAAAASALASLLEKPESTIKHSAFKFAILFCGARPSAAAFDHIYREIMTPSMHLIGKNDVMVPFERSIQLAESFNSSTLIHHPGNHFVPQGQRFTTKIVDFIVRQTTFEEDLEWQVEALALSAPRVFVKDIAQRSDMSASVRSGSPVRKIRYIRKPGGLRTRLLAF